MPPACSAIPTGMPSPPASRAWPPPGATPVEVASLYDTLADLGYEYGPLFQGLHAAWRAGEDIYADVSLPDGADATGYGIHPALLDAALHPRPWPPRRPRPGRNPRPGPAAVLLGGRDPARHRRHCPARPPVPHRLRHHHPGHRRPAGAPVATIGSLTLRPLPAASSPLPPAPCTP